MLRESRLLHAGLLHALAAAGHHDLIVVADAGLPVPPGTPLIDLAVVPGIPSAATVLRAVLAELVVQEAIVTAGCPAELAKIAGRDVPVRTVDHEELKALSADARVIVRTGEFTPYANVALVAGVPF